MKINVTIEEDDREIMEMLYRIFGVDNEIVRIDKKTFEELIQNNK